MNIEELTKQFLEQGGKVKHCVDGDRAIRHTPSDLYLCQCGCNGDFTDHSMRAGESGRSASVIIL